MTTQRVYSHSLVGFLVLALLVALGAGGCGESNATARRTIETDNQVSGWVGSEGGTCAGEGEEVVCDESAGDEYETMGYQEPGSSETLETEIATDDEYCPEQTGDIDEASMGCHDEEGESTEVTEEPGLVEEDEATYRDVDWMPVVTEEEDTSAQDSDMDEGSMVPPTADEQEAGDPTISEDSSDETGEASTVSAEEDTSAQIDNSDESSSDTVAPYIGGEDETTPDPNLDDTMSDSADDTPVDD